LICTRQGSNLQPYDPKSLTGLVLGPENSRWSRPPLDLEEGPLVDSLVRYRQERYRKTFLRNIALRRRFESFRQDLGADKAGHCLAKSQVVALGVKVGRSAAEPFLKHLELRAQLARQDPGPTLFFASFNLLQKGIITLQSVAHNDALRIQYKNLIKVQTQIPALAFFVLALICLCIAVWAMPQFKPIGQLKVTAKLQPHPKDIVTAYFDDQNSLAQSEIDTDGVISADILPKVALEPKLGG
jgi:hypothetical protein